MSLFELMFLSRLWVTGEKESDAGELRCVDKVFNTRKNTGIETIQRSVKYTGTTNKLAFIQSPATKYQPSDTYVCVKQRVKY